MQASAFDSESFLKTLTRQPGVYRMLDSDGVILYVGKARNLNKRVTSYFRKTGLGTKTLALMKQVADIQITITHTENEALILEHNLIKEYHPRYNILLRDDKSYPYIYLSEHQEFPRLGFYRGSRKAEGRYFGPYPSAGSIRENLKLLQKLFPVRQCEDTFYNNRSRPCLQYQIKRCTAPCVGLISHDDYMDDVRHAIMFLEGKNSAVINELIKKMERASDNREYENAARFRDQIASLKKLQEKQYIIGGSGDIDVIAVAVQDNMACIQVFFIRAGHNLGNKVFYTRTSIDTDEAEVLSAFIPQYYFEKQIPPILLVSHKPDDITPLTQVMSEKSGGRIRIIFNTRGERARWLEMARQNARHSLEQYLSSKANMAQRFGALQEALDLDSQPQRVECFDISHTMGEATVASCVVFDINGPLKSDYRRFNIKDITPGDDYAAMAQALQRRYKKLKEGEGKIPDILFIDGGKGQLAEAERMIEELQIQGVSLISIAKGPGRKPGTEVLHLSGRSTPIILPADSPALHLIQQVRDEAHRFAITGHRQRRARSRGTSVLENIPGLGSKRRQNLLKQFGGLQGVSSAGVEDLASVNGISRQLAQKIHDVFHGENESG